MILKTLFISFIVVSSSYHEIVKELQKYIETNDTFAAQINATFIESGHGPTSGNPTNFDIMYDFFDNILTWAPNGSNAAYVTYVMFNYTNTRTGNIITSNDIYAEWVINWLNTWREYLDSFNSTNVIPSWYSYVNMTEYIIPMNGFQSFNDFFYRRINMTYRPIYSKNDNSIVNIPCDGLLKSISYNVNANTDAFSVKNEALNLVSILGNYDRAMEFNNGTVIQIVLYFYNYHRYHSPINGVVVEMDQIGGFIYYWPYNINGQTPELFQVFSMVNPRGIVYIKDLDTNLLVAFVAVGIGEVSSVNFNINIGDTLSKGDEIGYFAYGGSTVLMIYQNDIINKTLIQPENWVQMGQSMAVINV